MRDLFFSSNPAIERTHGAQKIRIQYAGFVDGFMRIQYRTSSDRSAAFPTRNVENQCTELEPQSHRISSVGFSENVSLRPAA